MSAQQSERHDHKPPQRDKSESGWDDIAAEIVLGVLFTLALPLVIGWRSALTLAEQPRAWQRRKRARFLLTTGVAGVGGFVLARGVLLGLAWPLGWGTLAALLMLWAVLTPWAVFVALARLPWLATAQAEGRAPVASQDRIRRAIWIGAAADARAKAKAYAHDPETLGALLDDDRRDVLTKARDRRDSGRTTPQWSNVNSGIMRLPEKPARACVFGISGIGKTTLLLRIVATALARGWRVAYLDGKGDDDDARALLEAAAVLGVGAVWWRGQTEGGSGCPFDAWRGSRAEVITKAMSLAGSLKPRDGESDAAAYYRRRRLGVLTAVAEAGPWRSSTDLLGRLRQPAAWVRDRAALDALKHKDKGRAVHMATADELAAVLGPLGAALDGAGHALGWGWDDEDGAAWSLAVITVKNSMGEAATGAAALMLHDLTAYAENRRSRDSRPLLVIMDEAQTILDSPNAPDLEQPMEKMRSRGIGIIVAAQSVEGLANKGRAF